MADNPGDGGRVAAPSDWQAWQRWVTGVDWADWRGWLQRLAATDWVPGPQPGLPWQETPPAAAVSLELRAFEEDLPGRRIREHLTAAWPAFRNWWRDGANSRPMPPRRGRGSGSICRNSCPPGNA